MSADVSRYVFRAPGRMSSLSTHRSVFTAGPRLGPARLLPRSCLRRPRRPRRPRILVFGCRATGLGFCSICAGRAYSSRRMNHDQAKHSSHSHTHTVPCVHVLPITQCPRPPWETAPRSMGTPADGCRNEEMRARCSDADGLDG